jgi:hypothetical protein
MTDIKATRKALEAKIKSVPSTSPEAAALAFLHASLASLERCPTSRALRAFLAEDLERVEMAIKR